MNVVLESLYEANLSEIAGKEEEERKSRKE